MPATDVLVLGAGPTGLTAAAELRRHGATCRVLATGRAPAGSSRIVLHPRSLELFDALGLTAALADRGRTSPRLTVGSVEVGLRHLAVRHPHVLELAGQDAEAVLTAALEVPVERGIGVRSVTQHHDGVTVHVTGADGEPATVAARYVLATEDPGEPGALPTALGVGGTEHRVNGTVVALLDSYRCGRVFFAGELAHRVDPAGVADADTGVQDAVNLAWKLAYVCRGLVPDGLLHTYHTERHPAGENLRATASLTSMLRRSSASSLFRGLTTKVLAGRAAAELVAGIVAQTRLTYRDTTMSRVQRDHGALAAGDRVPDLRFAAADGETWLYDLLRRPGYALIAAVAPGHERLAGLMRQVGEAYAGLISPYVVRADGEPADDPVVPSLVDAHHELRTRLHARDGHLLLVRPDGHLAFHLPAAHTARLPNLLAPWVVTKATTPELTPTHSVLG